MSYLLYGLLLLTVLMNCDDMETDDNWCLSGTIQYPLKRYLEKARATYDQAKKRSEEKHEEMKNFSFTAILRFKILPAHVKIVRCTTETPFCLLQVDDRAFVNFRCTSSKDPASEVCHEMNSCRNVTSLVNSHVANRTVACCTKNAKAQKQILEMYREKMFPMIEHAQSLINGTQMQHLTSQRQQKLKTGDSVMAETMTYLMAAPLLIVIVVGGLCSIFRSKKTLNSSKKAKKIVSADVVDGEAVAPLFLKREKTDSQDRMTEL